MPEPSKESLAKEPPPASNADCSSASNGTGQGHVDPRKEPLANHGVKHQPGITFAAQDKLPKLPIPELEGTLNKYVKVLKPLQSKKEQAHTASAVQEFLRKDGSDLQERLKKYATGKTSYIEQFCTYAILLSNQSSLDIID